MTGKEAKAEKVTALRAKFDDTTGMILSDYRGLNVQDMVELRKQLREASVELRVVKNTLARRAAVDTMFEPLTEYFVGPTSIAFTSGDAAAMAKAMTEYIKTRPNLEIRVGMVEGQLLTPEQVTAIAELPPREVLLGRALGSMTSPLSGLVGVLQGIQRQFLYALKAIQTAKEDQS